MTKLNTNTNLTCHDDLYQELVELHNGLSDHDSRKTSAKLVFLLANHIGDNQVVAEAIEAARANTAAAKN
ncbi:MAG: DUF2783 domain-containing protein [Pseudomonadota bacterium]